MSEEPTTFTALGMTFIADPLSAREESELLGYDMQVAEWGITELQWLVKALLRRAHEGIAEFVIDDSERNDAFVINDKLDEYTLPQLLYMGEKLLEHCKPPSVAKLKELFPDEQK